MRKPTAKTVIRKAYRLLTDPARWTRGSYALDKLGRDVGWDNKHAVCFCMEGAVRRMSDEADWGVRVQALEAVSKAVGADWNYEVPSFNDHHSTTHKAVLKKLREAYRLAGGSRP